MAKYYRATQRGRSQFKNNVRMGKMFTTRSGKYGCYVYTNGKRTHFEEDPDAKARRQYRR